MAGGKLAGGAAAQLPFDEQVMGGRRHEPARNKEHHDANWTELVNDCRTLVFFGRRPASEGCCSAKFNLSNTGSLTLVKLDFDWQALPLLTLEYGWQAVSEREVLQRTYSCSRPSQIHLKQ